MAVFAILTVWLRLHIVRTTYEIGQANQMIRNSQQSVEKLEAELARLRSPSRLEELAKKYQLQPPTSAQVVRFGSP